MSKIKERKLIFKCSVCGITGISLVRPPRKYCSCYCIFKRYSIPVNRQNKIFDIMEQGFNQVKQEKSLLRLKHIPKEDIKIYRYLARLNLNKLQNDVNLLLNQFYHNDNKNLTKCPDVLLSAIASWEFHCRVRKEVGRKTLGKTFSKLEKNPKDLRSFTKMIKELVGVSNPVFRERRDNYEEYKNRIKETTFQAVADFLNSQSSAYFFTPEQIKARYHK